MPTTRAAAKKGILTIKIKPRTSKTQKLALTYQNICIDRTESEPCRILTIRCKGAPIEGGQVRDRLHLYHLQYSQCRSGVVFVEVLAFCLPALSAGFVRFVPAVLVPSTGRHLRVLIATFSRMTLTENIQSPT